MVTRWTPTPWLLCLVLGSAPMARAEEPPSPGDQAAIEEAKQLFRQGVELFGAGDLERALTLFSKSREAFPSVQNTSNVAICLDELGRYDEALEMYERLLVEFKDQLNDADKKAIGPSMAALRKKVGSVFVSSNVDGRVVVDGRARAELPLTVPIRVLPGDRQVRVIRNGYVTWEKQITVKEGESLRVDARLEPLAEAGLLRVEVPTGPGSQVFVDGAPMGSTPWEGTLGPGPHVVWTVNGERGSVPKKVVVVQGQTAVIVLEDLPLGGALTVSVEPPSATITVGDALLGKGRFSGRLPVGEHQLAVSEEGYHRHERKLRVHPSDGRTLRIELEVDPEHPRWPRAVGGEGFVQAFGGFAFGPGFGATAETQCVTCPDDTTVLGLMVGARGGYRFGFGLGLELGAGYLRLGASFDRVAALDDQPGVLYPIADDLLVHGPFASVGMSFRHLFHEHVGVGARASAGAFFEAATDAVHVRATRGGEEAALSVQDPEPVARAVSVFTQGDLGLELAFGPLQLAVAMGVVVFVTEGATHEQRTTSLPLQCDPTVPSGIGCIRSGTALPDEKAHGVFFVGLPQLHVGYAF